MMRNLARRSLGVRQKLLFLFSVLALLFLGFSVFSTLSQRYQWALLQSGLEMQKRGQLTDLITLLGQSQEVLVRDYTFWDDMVEFSSRPDPVFARDNLDTTMRSYQIDAAWVINLAGEWVYANDGLAAGHRASLPMANLARLHAIFADGRRLTHFFCWVEKELWEIRGGTIHPGADSQRVTPPRGYFFTGKKWNPEHQAKLERLIDGRVALVHGDQETSGTTVREPGEYRLTVTMPAWDAQPAARLDASGVFLVLADLSRQSMFDLAIAVAVSLALLVTLALALRRWLHVPLTVLSTALANAAPAALIDMRRQSDEFGRMADVAVRFFEQQDVITAQARTVQNLLDNTGQGILSFSSALVVGSECSRECQRVFGTPVAGSRFPALMYPTDPREEALLEGILTRMFAGNAERREILRPLLPTKLERNGLHLTLDFRLIQRGDGGEEMMVVATDVSERRRLEARMEEERLVLARVVKIVVHPTDFRGLLGQIQLFLGDGDRVFADAGEQAGLRNLFRSVHTFKASCALFDLGRAVAVLAALEQVLRARLDVDEGPHAFVAQWRTRIEDALEDDLAPVRRALGGEPWAASDGHIRVSEQQLDEIEGRVRALLPREESARLADECRSLRHRSLREMLNLYPDYTCVLAARIGKAVVPFAPTGDDVLVDPRWAGPVVKALIHLFRNAVDHGIDTPEERTAVGKDAAGVVSVHIDRDAEHVRITVSDDGRGVDLDHLRRVAAERGLLVPEGAEAALDLVWLDGVTTRPHGSSRSGLGEGLPAILQVVRDRGGRVGIESKPGDGTRVWIELPLPSPPVHVSAVQGA